MEFYCSNILIVDDHKLFLESISLFLKSNKTCQNLEEANSFHSAIEHINTKHFNCVLIDINLKGQDAKGIELGIKIKNKHPETKIILMSGYIKSIHLDIFQIQDFDGLVSKFDTLNQFKYALHKVLRNQKYCSEIFNNCLEYTSNEIVDGSKSGLLTQKEQLVYKMLLTDKSYKEIARLLKIETSTFKKHTCRIYKKLGLKSRIELINKSLS